MRVLGSVLAATACLAIAAPAMAEGIRVSGQIDCVVPPADVDFNNDRYRHAGPVVLEERASVVLERDLMVDAISPASFTRFDESPDFTLPGGMTVSSYLIHFDPEEAGENVPFDGTVHFDREILAIMITQTTMDASDAVVGIPPPALYQGDSGSRSGETLDGDSVTWIGTDVQITFETGGFKDQVRVLVVPESPPDGGMPDAGADASADIGVDTGSDVATPTSFRGAGGCSCESVGGHTPPIPLSLLFGLWALSRLGRSAKK